MSDTERTIAFLTSKWTNVDENIRQGITPGGVPSISKAWTIFNKHGWNVHVFIMTDLESEFPAQTVELEGVTFHWLDNSLGNIRRLQGLKKLLHFFKLLTILRKIKMIKTIKKTGIKPDIIYCMRDTFAWMGLLWSVFVKARCVLRMYGTFVYDIWFEKKNNLFDRIKTIPELITYKLPFDHIIITNDGTQGDKVAEWMKVNKKIFWFPINGVDKNLYIRDFDAISFKEKIGVPKTSPMLLLLGRLTYWKRQDRVVKAMPTILKKYPEAKLVIVGKGELREDLEILTNELGLSESVLFYGAILHKQIKYFFNASDIFIMPYDVSNLSNTLIESLIAGCCVLTRDVGSTTEVVSDGENAVVLSPGETEEFAEAIIDLLGNPDKRRILSKNAYETAMERFSTWDERMEEEYNLISNLVNNFD
ncbi:GDP-mannose-dependent alpha-(1-6)-phosphatidylinositol monomannoside mannosyltransferase [Limihaloglobus sulfuriphilus]|uniref:GDP-mannose-dependent alpha-(1-6)-phosphatidylinositol monomannoside mannosyltransferase n=1 Tax=Limihaloglobus sulfuriphilus TaxID=1851148 RepID=A0A1Q2MFN8_9BACT|nr:glycosyltransferase family 4 protein [Limihaloglobus sulfuriphilus]AQQ71511.1 GDP-mannose-dependent alpha-(1-6)-phosphatidylinositol monomannoside mannosyltransferase [Limihaloglobus sulfuriphilus]